MTYRDGAVNVAGKRHTTGVHAPSGPDLGVLGSCGKACLPQGVAGMSADLPSKSATVGYMTPLRGAVPTYPPFPPNHPCDMEKVQWAPRFNVSNLKVRGVRAEVCLL